MLENKQVVNVTEKGNLEAALYDNDPTSLASFVTQLRKKYSDTIDFRPELGISRDPDILQLQEWAYPCIESGAFFSLDLYSTEDAKPPEVFIPFYTKAKNKGMKLKAHDCTNSHRSQL